MKRIHFRLALATLAAGLALTGAGAGAAEPTIRIGVLSPNTGPYAAIGEDVRNGFQLYVDEIGAKAGGARLELVFEDSQAKPDVGLTKARKLVESDKVAFLGGVVSSSVAYALRDYVVEKNIPYVVSVSSADGLTQQLAAPNIFRTNSSGSQASHPFGKWLYDKGYRRLVLVATGYAAGFEQTGGIARTFTQAGGKIVQTLYPPLGTADFAPFLSSIKVKDADAVAAVFAGSEAIKFVKQYDEYGLKGTLPLVASSMLTDDMILEAQGKSALGILSSSHYSARVKTPENEAFVKAYQKRFGRTPTFYSEGSYVAARAIGEAIKALKGDVSDKSKVNKTLAGVKFAAPRGAFRFDDYRSPVHDIYVFEVKRVDGKLVNEPVAKVPDVSQFYTWQPKEFMEMKPYRDIANEWAK
ncbi:ABC transporter substrate-binding protein [Pigmentiphaga sp. H8]|uniref:ABC transporter substrate-binding protein n=1 Tax=unclassified Pigmentiphaga TaxID=2626614 RepID=UPI000F5AA3FE|nr:ABC transporter substrate-binding protein [Pigmentiphaga sp. H8]AZG11419.1 ABC transporter substrate-binding protein [Pigmentiphaga sp. H8]